MEIFADKNITILRLEAAISEGEPKFPPFIKIAKEVTDDPAYSTKQMRLFLEKG